MKFFAPLTRFARTRSRAYFPRSYTFSPESPKSTYSTTGPYGFESSAAGEAIREDPDFAPEHNCYPKWMQRLRMNVYLLFEVPESSTAAARFSTAFFVAILLSILGFMLELEPGLQFGVLPEFWSGCEIFFTMLFTMEYILRLSICDVLGETTKMGFICNRGNICDLLAISPWYFEKVFKGNASKSLRVLRAVRLTRLLRIFRKGKNVAGMRVMMDALSSSSQALSVLAFLCLVSAILYSSALYFFEKTSCPPIAPEDFPAYEAACAASSDGWLHGKDGALQLCCDSRGSALDFQSIPIAFWWCAVTMTTVGFGDIYPRTLLGRVVAWVTMLSGILVIALPVAIVGSRFQEVYNEMELTKRRKEEGKTDNATQSRKEMDNEALLHEKIVEHPALRALSRRVMRRITRLSNDQEEKRDKSESVSYQTDIANTLVTKLKAMDGMDPNVNKHVKELTSLIEQSLRQEEILQHLEAREQYLSACVQHQYEDVLRHLDLTYFPWPRRNRERAGST